MRNTIGMSPLLVLLSLLIGAAVGGLVGAFLAVPIVASIEIVLARLQARETPVAQDPAAIETPDEDVVDEYERSLPDAGEGMAASELTGIRRQTERGHRDPARVGRRREVGSAAPIRQPAAVPRAAIGVRSTNVAGSAASSR